MTDDPLGQFEATVLSIREEFSLGRTIKLPDGSIDTPDKKLVGYRLHLSGNIAILFTLKPDLNPGDQITLTLEKPDGHKDDQ